MFRRLIDRRWGKKNVGNNPTDNAKADEMVVVSADVGDTAQETDTADTAREAELYEAQRSAFSEYAAQFSFSGLETFAWYHVVELENGIVTPGEYDYRASIKAFQFPDDMRGMRVLDIGSATGFFAFEFERRGADVYSVELPSLLDWDMIATDRDRVVRGIMDAHAASSFEEAHWRHLDGPFMFCHQRRKSSIRRVYSTIYNLKPSLFDGRQFDIVYLGDVLLHLHSPLAALNAVAPLCGHKLIISSDIMPNIAEPILRFMGEAGPSSDARTWWAFTRSSLEQMLLRVGFRAVVDAGTYSGVHRRQLSPYERLVIHATK